MKTLLLLPALGLALLPLLVTTPATSPLARAATETYQVDASHSTVLFRIQHAGAANFWGRFNELSGTFVLDSEDASKNSVEIEVVSGSVDTNDEGRDKHIKSADFFDAKSHPEISFASSKVEQHGDGFEVTGTLSFLGKQREISFQAEQVGRNEVGGKFGTRAGLEAQISIKRTDFGNSTYVNEGMLGNEVLLLVSLEGVLQD